MIRRIRCAIYTRKSSDEGLEQDFNSLDAQREACEAYILSQKAEGWVVLKDRYDDGGLSGGTLERPALKALLAEVDAGRVDRIVVYKIDRLTRALSDFAKIVDRLDAVEASFVSVTQSFNTATSMGRLTLNMLLSFAQFEREVTGERIRDKIRASKKRGLWMGGLVPIGYRPVGRTLEVHEDEARLIRQIYELYDQSRSIRCVVDALRISGFHTPQRTHPAGKKVGGKPFAKAHVHRLLTNPIYAGRIRHHAEVHPGQHPAIIDRDRWDALQDLLQTDAARNRGMINTGAKSPLCGKLEDETGDTLTPSHTNKNGKRLRYYISRRLITGQAKDHPGAWRVPGPAIEQTIEMAVQARIEVPTFLTNLLPDADAVVLHRLRLEIDALFAREIKTWAHLILKVTLAPEALTIALNADAIAIDLQITDQHLDPTILTVVTPMRLRRRGQETRLILGGITADRDPKLMANIQKARDWYARIRAGKSMGNLAKEENLPTSRIQHMIDLAFLAPDILEKIVTGTQPAGLTSEWIKRNSLPADWNEQRKTIAALLENRTF